MSTVTLDEMLKTLEADDTKIPLSQTVSESALFDSQMKEDSEKSDRSFFESAGTAYSENLSIKALGDSIDKATTVDIGAPITNFTPELIKTLTEGLPIEAAKEILEDAKDNGFQTAMKQREFALKTLDNRKRLEADGFTGIAANAFSVMFDPFEWSAILGLTAAATTAGTPVSGAAALTAGTIKQAYNVKRAFKVGALATAAESAAFEGIRANVKYDIDANDVFIAGGVGALLGGSLNAGRIAFQKAGQRSKIAQKVVMGKELTPSEKLFHDQFNVDALAEKIIARELTGEAFLESTKGGQQVKSFTKLKNEDVATLPQQAGWSMFGLRELISTTARMGASNIAWARYTGRALGGNFTGYEGGKLATNVSASEIAESLQGVFRDRLATLLPKAQARFVKETGTSVAEFNRAVSRYVRGIDRQNVTDDIKIVAEEISRVQNRLAELAAEADVSGFTKKLLGKNPFYMSRIFDNDRIAQIKARYGDKANEYLDELIETSIRREQLNIEDQVTKMLTKKGKVADIDTVGNYINKIAVAYRKGITSSKIAKRDIPDSSEMTLEDLGDMLKAEGFELDEIDVVTEILTLSNIPRSHKRARNRMVLNEGTTIKVTNPDGELEDLAFTDLLVEDAEQLVNSYIFQLSGAIGLARNGINTNVAGSQFDKLKGKIISEGEAKGLPQDEIRKAADAAQFMYDGITGRLKNREEVQNITDMNVAVRAFSFSVNMGMSGMSALMELTNSMFEYSFTTILKSAPAYKQLFDLASKNGRLPDGLMRELVETMGMGNEVALGKWNNVTRFDTEDIGTVISPERASFSKKGSTLRQAVGLAERGAYGAQKHVAYWSGLTGVTQTLRRLSMMHFTNEFALAARKGKLPFSNIKRQQLGITDEMGDKILKVMNSNLVEKAPNGRVTKLNIDKWDEDVREAFRAYGFKDARTNVQETNLGSTNRWMKSSQVGRTMFQFMNFTLGSLEQQTQRLGVRGNPFGGGGRDASVAKILVAAAAMGGLMYLARVQLNAAGRSDADEYIKERMKPANWTMGALQQIGAASMFTYIYQVSTGAMSGNSYAITPPAISIAQNAAGSLANIWEGDMTESEYRKALRVLPYQSLYGARQIINSVADYFAN
jgi:hypothetical protein